MINQQVTAEKLASGYEFVEAVGVLYRFIANYTERYVERGGCGEEDQKNIFNLVDGYDGFDGSGRGGNMGEDE